MSLERRHVIAGAFVAFVSWALLTDWLPSLRWIPYAFVAGIIATTCGAAIVIITTSHGSRSINDGDTTLPGARLNFHDPRIWEEEKALLNSRGEYRRPLIFPEASVFSQAVDGLLDLIIRDNVTSWYTAISRRPLFQHEIDRCIRSVLLTLAARLTHFDLVELGVANALPIATTHLKEFYEAERAVRGRELDNYVTEGEELNLAVASKYRNGHLHSVAGWAGADITPSVEQYLRELVAKLLPVLLPDNMKTSPAVTALVREIVACAVLRPVVQLFLEPDTWNQMIVNFGGPLLHDRKAVRKVRAALDQNAPLTPKHTRGASQNFPRLRPFDSERQFERFIRAIRHVTTLSEARRFRSDIVSQLRRDAAFESQDAAYLRRLEAGKRLLDQRISSLATNSAANPKLSLQTGNSHDEVVSRKRRATLRELLYDASGLSYFMEYMDRQKLMRLVQFYVVVDGFRGPLEGDNDDIDLSHANDTEAMDIAQMWEGYLSQPELQASDAAVQRVRAYLEYGVTAKQLEHAEARRAVLQTQTQVYNMMKQTHFEAFKRSDLYYKWLAIDDNPASKTKEGRQAKSPLSPDNPNGRGPSPIAGQRRPQLASANRESELRRAVLSSSNLKDTVRPSDNLVSRRSLDDTGLRAALFDDDSDDDRITQSVPSLLSYESDAEAAQEKQMEAKAVRAMSTALNEIVGEDDKESLFSEFNGRKSMDDATLHPSLEQAGFDLSGKSGLEPARPSLPSRPSDRERPSIASLGLVGGPSAHGVFVDDLFGDEAQKFAEDEREESDAPNQSDEDQVQEAAPGDLGLAEAIDTLNLDIEKLTAQKQIVDSLTAKAELTNNAAELRILRKSEQSLQREIKRKEMQKQQYIVQESDNNLYGRAHLAIKSVMVGREQDGHEYALYVIEVRRQAGEQMPAATWAITRRYSQFHELHKRLRARFPSVRELDFPRRQALFSLQRDFVEKRRITLERYLRSLLLVPAICRSRELRSFLSQSAISSNGNSGPQLDARDFVTRIYNSVSDGVDDFIGNIPVLDQLSVAGQNLITAASSQMNGGAANAPIDSLDPATHDPATAAEAEAELNAYEAKGAEPFVKPICDLFLETFELSKGSSWLRGRTVVVVLHQLLGGTIERKVREVVKSSFEDESLARYVDLLRTTMWPEGKQRQTLPPRTHIEKARTRKEASLILGALIPDMAGSVVGRANAQAASRKIVAALNNSRLNTHLLFTLIDEAVKIIFPEIQGRS